QRSCHLRVARRRANPPRTAWRTPHGWLAIAALRGTPRSARSARTVTSSGDDLAGGFRRGSSPASVDTPCARGTPLRATFPFPGGPLSRLLLSTAASFLIAHGCTPDTESATPEGYSWWDSGGEKAAFNALVGPFERSRPDIDVRNGYRRDSQEVRGDLGALMLQGVPPNTFQANAGADLLQWAAVDFAPAADGPFDGSLPSPQDSWNLLTDVSGLLGREALDALYPEVRRQVCVEASNAEHHLAVPVNIHRLNLLYYNTDRVADAERRFAMDSLCPENAAELAPSERPAFDLAISVGDGLSLTLLTFENLLLVVGKETAYRALLEGGDPSLWRAPMQRALGCLWYLSGAFI